MNAQKSLVVGSTGLVGKEVINELASKGIPVRALSRIDPYSSNPCVENIKVNFDYFYIIRNIFPC